MTFGEIRQDIYDYFGYGASPSPDVARRIDGFINESYLELMNRPSLSSLRNNIIPVTGVSGVSIAVLPPNVTKVKAMVNRTTRKPLFDLPLMQRRQADPGNSDSSSDPTHYTFLGPSPLALGISAAAELFVKSSHASDTGVQVTINGILSNGMPRRVGGTTLNGTTAVSLDSTITTWLDVLSFTLSGSALGDITLHEGSGSGSELARIPKGSTSSRYTQLQLYPAPSATVTLYADVSMSVLRLVDDADMPLIPDDYQWLITCGARMRQLSKNEAHTVYAEEKTRRKDGLAALIYEVTSTNGIQRRRREMGFSQLGPDYPAGT